MLVSILLPISEVITHIIMLVFRNPTASDRPTFEYLESELSEIEPLVMQASEMKARLGADVDNQDSLYPELQNKYK